MSFFTFYKKFVEVDKGEKQNFIPIRYFLDLSNFNRVTSLSDIDLLPLFDINQTTMESLPINLQITPLDR
ncbi:hypothetical protein SAMN06295967_107117 [Belliella buryatensis]|uniref:Uncharacterized protein n=1 Tax=Belliella buryatensis TaxID=1500549 RepID=A0A239DN70_9BACT|nr:hypothetical protein SAMN06295967_107117 [Belliella buryatensis]